MFSTLTVAPVFLGCLRFWKERVPIASPEISTDPTEIHHQVQVTRLRNPHDELKRNFGFARGFEIRSVEG